MKKLLKWCINNVVVFIVGFVIIITCILLLFDKLDVSAFLGINPNNDWLGYLGAVLGGLFTLIGVLLTINYENGKKKEEQSLQFKPIIQPCLDSDNNYEGFEEEVSIKQNNMKLGKSEQCVTLILKNKGRGETKNFKINSVNILESSSNLDLEVNYDKKQYPISDVEIIPEGYLTIKYMIPNSIINNDKNPIKGYIIIKTIVKYSDFIEFYEYEENYIIKIMIQDRNSIDVYDNKKGKKYDHAIKCFRDEDFKIKIKSSMKKINNDIK